MGSVYLPDRRGEGAYEYDGTLTFPKRYDDSRAYTIDLSELLDGDTISTATWSADGVTIDASSNTTTTISVRVSGAGEAECLVVTAGSETFDLRLKWRATDARADDYA